MVGCLNVRYIFTALQLATFQQLNMPISAERPNLTDMFI